MNSIRPLAKWDLAANSWRKDVSSNELGRALSIVRYKDIIHDERSPLNYILIADGYRVENLSKDNKTIADRTGGIKNVLSYFEHKRANYRIELLLVDNDAPLKEESVAFAEYIDCLAQLDDVASINYVGFSKCGVIGLDMIKYFRCHRSLLKTHIFSVSSPYLGTIVASPLALMAEVRKMIESKLGKNEFSESVVKQLTKLYHSVQSNSHMDLDIAVPGGVPKDLLVCYDPSFLDKIFEPANLRALKRVDFHNICTYIDKSTLARVIKSGDLTGLGLCIVNDILFEKASDGVVPISSQTAIEKHIETKTSYVNSTHNSIPVKESAHRILEYVAEIPEENVLRFTKN